MLPSPEDAIGFFSIARLLVFYVYHLVSCYFAENIVSEDLPLMTDGNLNSCEVINNTEPLRRKFIDVVLEMNCPSQDPVNLAIKFRNAQNCGLIKGEVALYTKTESRCHNNCNAILRRCSATDNQSNVDRCGFSCGCTGSYCQFMLVLKPLTDIEICEISIKH